MRNILTRSTLISLILLPTFSFAQKKISQPESTIHQHVTAIVKHDLAGRGEASFVSGNENVFTVNGSSRRPIVPSGLVSFDARAGGGSVDIRWTTANAIRFSHFEVERSQNGRPFTPIWEMPYLSERRQHRFTDANTGGGSVAYRLKIIDRDGSFRYSKTVRLKLPAQQ